MTEMVLMHTDNLSKTLQEKTRSAAEGQAIAGMVVRTLQTRLICSGLKSKKAESQNLEPELLHCRTLPRRLEDGQAANEFHTEPGAYFRQLYFKALDLAVNCIQDKFDQPGYKMYSNLEQVLLKTIQGADVTDELGFVRDIHKDDLDLELLKSQLLIFNF